MKSRNRLVGAGLIVLALGGLLAYRMLWLGPETIRLPVVEGCALHLQSCVAELPVGGTVTFEITPRRATPSDAMQLHARFENVEPVTVGARFKGVNMNMGQLEYLVHKLARVDDGGDGVAFTGRGGVFACSVGVMQWLVLVKIQVGDTLYEVPYRFETTSNLG